MRVDVFMYLYTIRGKWKTMNERKRIKDGAFRCSFYMYGTAYIKTWIVINLLPSRMEVQKGAVAFI